MQCSVAIHIPRPPSTNTLYRNVPGKGRAKSDEYKRWQREAGWKLASQRPGFVFGAVAIVCTIPRAKDRRRRDLDNAGKPILDLLVKHKVIEDDSQVERLTLEYGDRDDVLVTVDTVGAHQATEAAQ